MVEPSSGADIIEPAIMLDLGSFNIKAGYAGEDAPKVVMPSIIGKPRFPGVLVGMD